MIRLIIWICALLISFTFYSCAPKPIPVTPAEWRYEESAVRLHLTADPLLNLYNEVAHALHLCVYQLKDPNAFNHFAGSSDGIAHLLQCQLFDHAVANARAFSIQPGTEQPLILDRAEGARYLGIATGYQLLEKEQTIRLIKIPIVLEEIKKGRITIETVQKPGILNVNLNLGSRQIEGVNLREGQEEK